MFYYQAGEDYVDIGRQTLNFPNPSSPSTELCYNVSLISDSIEENDETFVVVISSSDPGVRLQNSKSVVTIKDSIINSELQKLQCFFLWFSRCFSTNEALIRAPINGIL